MLQAFSGILFGYQSILISISGVMYIIKVKLVHANGALVIDNFVRSVFAADFPYAAGKAFCKAWVGRWRLRHGRHRRLSDISFPACCGKLVVAAGRGMRPMSRLLSWGTVSRFQRNKRELGVCRSPFRISGLGGHRFFFFFFSFVACFAV